jgi:deoxyadenosine/deoxycytidine kinase
MQKIIFISGPIGSGKTTIASELYKRLDNVALIEADKMVTFNPCDMSKQIFRVRSENCDALIQTYLNENVQNIICEGYIQNQFELDAFEEIFKSRAKIKLFWLELSREERQERVADRGQGVEDTPEFMDEYENANSQPWPFTSESTKLKSIELENKSSDDIVKVIVESLD